MSDETGFGEGLLIGLVAGAVLGALFAPEKGHKLRTYLYQGFGEITELIEEEIYKNRKGEDLCTFSSLN